MSPKIKKFIEDNISLIEDNEWKEIYKRVNQSLYQEQVGEFTQLMLNAGIDPLDYMEEIPENYLYDSSITSFTIPNHIKSIGIKSFSGSDLHFINIGDKISEIGHSAFSYCSNLLKIELPYNLRFLGSETFKGCTELYYIKLHQTLESLQRDTFEECFNLNDLYYEGTKDQWESIRKSSIWNKFSPISTIHCTDGDIKLKPQLGK